MQQIAAAWNNFYNAVDENIILIFTGLLAVLTVPISQFIEDLRPVLSQIVLVCGVFISIFGVMLSARKWWRGSIINPKRKKDGKDED